MPWDFNFNNRLWKRVDVSDINICWNWKGAKSKAGYGVLTINYKLHYAHRLAWSLHNDQEIPKGIEVCHSCDNPACCNPYHLFLGTHQDNIQDAANKKRMMYGENHISAKATDKLVMQIREMHTQGINHHEISRRTGISRQSVNDIIYRRTWKHVR